MTINWKQPAVPRHVIQMLVVDRNHRFLLMHRTNNVTSARNVWSIPTGTHEIGESILTCLVRELQEEYALDAQAIQVLDQYENIAGDADAVEQFHWVMSIYLVQVADVTAAINKEPDKHDIMLFPDLLLLNDDLFLDNYKFHDSLHSRLFQVREDYLRQAKAFLNVEDSIAYTNITNMQPVPESSSSSFDCSGAPDYKITPK